MINLKLTLDQVNDILATLGHLPTSSNAWPLFCEIKKQAENQVVTPPNGSLAKEG